MKNWMWVAVAVAVGAALYFGYKKYKENQALAAA